MPDSAAILWAAWVTAIATISATVVAAWLGLRDRWTQLSAAADLSRQKHAAHVYSTADILIVELANRSASGVVVTAAYWRIGWFKPDILAASVSKQQLPLRIESKHGASFPIVVDDIRRALIRAARERKGPVALIVRTTTGGKVRCELTPDAKQSISIAQRENHRG